jgi:S1-C subfamily serine protease
MPVSWESLTIALCLGQGLSIAPPPLSCLLEQPSAEIVGWNLEPVEMERLYRLARSLTVRVRARRNSGSGVLIRRQGQLYTVLTNRHVLTAGAPFLVEAPDGQVYRATRLSGVAFGSWDLAVVQFRSATMYAIASLGDSRQLGVGEPIVAAGFPIEAAPLADRGFFVSHGQMALRPQQALQGGYQLGYTNPLHQGMSGGPVLNRRGEVVGLNSLHAYPLWGDPYIFEDGSRPDSALRSVIERSSWAVPIETFRCLTDPKSLKC